MGLDYYLCNICQATKVNMYGITNIEWLEGYDGFYYYACDTCLNKYFDEDLDGYPPTGWCKMYAREPNGKIIVETEDMEEFEDMVEEDKYEYTWVEDDEEKICWYDVGEYECFIGELKDTYLAYAKKNGIPYDTKFTPNYRWIEREKKELVKQEKQLQIKKDKLKSIKY